MCAGGDLAFSEKIRSAGYEGYNKNNYKCCPSDPIGAFPYPMTPFLESRGRERGSNYKCFELSTHVLL
jgi:hypothetical protein